MDWKDRFNPDVLAHGWDLFREHQIGPVYQQDNIYEARFPDRSRTNAVINNGFVESVSCTCPRSRFGELCEHEAALLFTLEHPASKQVPPKAAPFGQPSASPLSKPASQSESEQEKTDRAEFLKRSPASQAPKSIVQPDDSSSLLDELERLFGLDAQKNAPDKPDLFQQANVNSPVDPKPIEKDRKRPDFHQEMLHDPEPSALSGYPSQPGASKMSSHSPFIQSSDPAQPADTLKSAFNPESFAEFSHPEEKPTQSEFENPQHFSFEKAPHFNEEPHPGKPLHPQERSAPQQTARPLQREIPESKTPFEDLWHALTAKPRRQPQPSQSQPDRTPHEAGQPALKPDPMDVSKSAPSKPQTKPEFENDSPQANATHPAGVNSEPKLEPEHFEKPKSQKSTDRFLVLLESLKPDELIGLLDTYSKTHPEFQDFILAGSLKSNPDAIGLILEEARTRLKACLIQNGSFHPRQATQKAAAFLDWLNDQVLALVQARQEASAADLLQSVLIELNESVHDDDDWEVNQIVSSIFKMYSHLLAGSPAPVIKETFSWLENHLSGVKPMIFDREMIQFVQKPDFDRKELASLKLALLLKLLEEKDRFLLGPLYRRQLVRSILALTDSFPELETQALPFIQMYGNEPYVLLEQAEKALKESRLQKAELLLKKARSQKLTSAQEEDVCRKLIAIYTAQNQPDLALRELKELIFVLQDADPDDVFQLKSLESEQEWTEDFKKFEETASVELLILVYDHLGLDDKLLSALEKKPNLHDLILYEDRLAKADPDRTAKLWLVNAKLIAMQANERHDYHRIGAALRKAAAHPTTHDEALQFAAELKVMNHRRKALLEELEHAGF